jgi:transposase InsO family protein
VIIDIYSRYVVGWLLAENESAALAEKLLADTIAKQDVDRDTLTVHADNGSSMASKPVAFLLADLGVTKTHSRPHTSNDNPFSEAQFKTGKYRPDFPDTFGSLADARAFCQRFFTWYNTEHYHSLRHRLPPPPRRPLWTRQHDPCRPRRGRVPADRAAGDRSGGQDGVHIVGGGGPGRCAATGHRAIRRSRR